MVRPWVSFKIFFCRLFASLGPLFLPIESASTTLCIDDVRHTAQPWSGPDLPWGNILLRGTHTMIAHFSVCRAEAAQPTGAGSH